MTAAEWPSAPFARYWLSGFIADFGDGVRLTAFPLLAVQVTRSPAAVAAVTALQGLPWIVIGLGMGALVERRDLRATMVGVDAARAVMIAALAVAALTGHTNLALLYAAAFLTGVGAMVRDTAASTAVPRLVHPSGLERANGRVVAGRVVGHELAGPAAGGWLFGVAAALPFAVNAGGLAVAVLLLLTLPSVFAAPRRADEHAGAARTVLDDIRAGLAWLRHDQVIRNLLITIGIVAAADGAYLAILVLYVTRDLHRSAAVYGLLLGVGAIGGIIAGAGCARLTRRMGAVRALTAAIVTMAAAQLTLGLTSNVIVTGVTLFASSGAFAVLNTTSMSLRQRRTPAGLLARVNSAYLTIGRSAEAAGGLIGGGIATAVGIRAPILAGVVPLLAAAAITARSGKRRE